MAELTRPQAESVALSWRIKERPGFTTVEFFGEIDENADFAELRRRLRGAVVFHLAEVRRINSCGVRECRKCRAAVHDGGYVFIYTRLPEQNARTIWGHYFPEFCEHETRLYELGQMHDCIEAFGRLYLERVTCFRFPRVASLERLLQQARNHHYSTFALYEPAEFERDPPPLSAWRPRHPHPSGGLRYV